MFSIIVVVENKDILNNKKIIFNVVNFNQLSGFYLRLPGVLLNPKVWPRKAAEFLFCLKGKHKPTQKGKGLETLKMGYPV